MHALDLNVKQTVGVNLNPGKQRCHVLNQALFVPLFSQPERAVKSGLRRQSAQTGEFVQMAPPGASNAAVNQGRQGSIGLSQPSPGRDSISFVAKAIREQIGKIGKNGFDHQVTVKRRYAVDLVAGQH